MSSSCQQTEARARPVKSTPLQSARDRGFAARASQTPGNPGMRARPARPAAKPRRYPTGAVRHDGETPVAAATGDEVKARWVATADVRWVDERPMHPDDDDLELEVVVEKMSKSRGNVENPDDVIGRYGADVIGARSS